MPGTRFFYTVGDDVNGFSSVQSARVPPPSGTPGVTVAVIGDLGTTNFSADTVAHVASQYAALGSMSSLLLVGDLSYSDGAQPIWDVYSAMIQPIASMMPIMYLVGNHEYVSRRIIELRVCARRLPPSVPF